MAIFDSTKILLKGSRFRYSNYTRAHFKEADQESMRPFISTASFESDRRLPEILPTHVPLRLVDEIAPVFLISVVYTVIVFFSLSFLFLKGTWDSLRRMDLKVEVTVSRWRIDYLHNQVGRLMSSEIKGNECGSYC